MRKGGKNTIQNVRIVDSDAGSTSAYVERCIAGLMNSESNVTVLCNTTQTLATGSSASGLVAGNFTGANVRGTDEFTSLAQQFNTFRIRAIRFDVYDINPGVPATNAFSVFHDVAPYNTTYNPPPIANVIDGPDAKSVPPGTGVASFYWRAHGTLENDFQAGDVQGAPSDFGGLRYAFYSPTLSTDKYQVVMRAVVDFRGRV